MKILLFTILLSIPLNAEILSFKEISKTLAKKSQKRSTNNNKESVIDKAIGAKKLKEELEQTKKKLASYRYMTKLQMNGPFIMKDMVIHEADLIGANNLFTIYATVTPRSVVFSNIKGADIPKGSKISCQVYTQYKRICGLCDRLIINGQGQDIKAELYNRDGSPCAIGKLSDDGEDYLLGIGISEMARGALAVAQSSTPTAYGNIVQKNAGNQLSQGVQNVGSEATDLFKNEYKNREPIVTLRRGSPVAIFFHEGVSL